MPLGVKFRKALRNHESRDSWLRDNFPGVAARRAKHRATLARQDYIAASYDSATSAQQRVSRAQIAQSESAVLEHGNLAAIRSWSENTFRSNIFYAGLLRMWVDHWLGTGHTVVPQTGDDGLNTALSEGFTAYCAKGGGFDASGRFSFRRWERMLALERGRGGDALLYKSDDGYQVFEAQQIGTPLGYDRSKHTIVNGVEVGRAGRPTRYWVSGFSEDGYLDASTARGLRADLCHHYENIEWVSGYRGVPVLAQALPQIEQLTGMLDTELYASRGAASIMASIKSDDVNVFDALSATKNSADAKTANGPRVVEMSPGNVIRLRGEEEFKIHSANRPSAQFQDFVRLTARICGAPIGMPLELSMLDITGSSYSTSRMQLQVCQRIWAQDVANHDDNIVSPVYFGWMDEQTGVKLDGWASDVHPFRFSIMTPEPIWIDEQKRALANLTGMRSGEESLTNLANKMRRSVEDILEERAVEIVVAKRLAEKYDIDDWHDVLLNVGKWETDPLFKMLEAQHAKIDSADGEGDDDAD